MNNSTSVQKKALTGEIRFEDGTSILIPQPDVSPIRDTYINTIPELPEHQAVMQYAAASTPHSTPKPQTEPLWATLVLLLGALLLVGVGTFFITLGLLS